MTVQFDVDGQQVTVPDDGASLLEVLRDRLGLRSAKDGCSPQGQCGCCTVLVDGAPRVACVTPARRVAGRTVTTLEGLDPSVRDDWARRLLVTGGSQCGFCTPGIIVRLAALEHRTAPARPAVTDVEQALLAHLCRCTGWRSIVDAAIGPTPTPAVDRDLAAAARRAALEGHAPQRVGADVCGGDAGFADDRAPVDALVAVMTFDGEWVVAETLTEARRLAGKVQGRRSTVPVTWPLDVPPGDWARTLRTTWVEPAYLEPDASWCAPGGEPYPSLANGGAFGGKATSPLPAVARRLADEHGRAVRALWSREDVVRHGPKRPPIAAGIDADGRGVLRAARTAGIADAVRSVAPGVVVEELDVAGPPTSLAPRGAGWAEAAVLLAAAQGADQIEAPNGSWASAAVAADGTIAVRVRCGAPLDTTVLRSYCVGAAHMALGWVTSEGIAVDGHGAPQDLTIRSFGILRAQDMPAVEVAIDDDGGDPVNGSDVVFAAVAAAVWAHDGLAQDWPTRRTHR
ncbi:MAG TPA: 2Fe-2S iron-sulfur cluster-binding protein [Acidimicrobiales bacterium]|nr:2Fe-2S iron-sulfur cluster-binding protein [Acidimicrobiales bacterium]